MQNQDISCIVQSRETSLLTSLRKQHILDVLERDGQLVAKTLGRELGLSEDTIRRDLRELASEGRLQRVHGGALPASPAVVDFPGRERIATAAKVAIGRAAAELIRSGEVVFVDGGTTTLQLVRHLAPDLRATVVTHSPTIAVELARHPSVEVVLIGGRLFKHSIVTVGASTTEAIGRIRADTYFLGVTGLHPVAGLSTGDLEEADVKRALIANSAETVLLASAEKFDAASPYTIGPIRELSAIVTDRSVPEAVTAPYAAAGIRIVRS